MFDRIKGFLLEEDDPKDKPKPTALKPPVSTVRPPPQVQAPPQYAAAPVAIDPQVRATLEKALEGAAQPALSALQASMRKLERAIPDFDARLSAALALLDGTPNSSPKQVLVDIQECLTALQAQEKKGLDGANAARQSRVGGIEQKLAANAKRLTELEAEAARIHDEQLTLGSARDQAAQEIDAMLGAISGAAEQIRTELQTLKGCVETKGV
jgi:chromosome segregation ATPase